jgi:two-component system response regulator HydG
MDKRSIFEKRSPRVLIVDDQQAMAEMLAEGLVDRGYDAVAFSSGRAALEELARRGAAAIVTDMRMPDLDGLELLAEVRKLPLAKPVPVIVMTAYGAIDSAVEAIRRGAFHYLAKPFKLDELVLFLERALQDTALRREADSLRTTLRERFGSQAVLGNSKSMRTALDVLERVSQSDVPILFLGETGTGKSLLARVLHAQSERKSGPFVAVNCAAIPEALLESELFGHVKGAFTGASADRPGLFAEADGGVLFLDEIAELAAPVQAKLLHVLEGHAVRPVGATREREVDVRILAATHRDLRARVRDGLFREDLLYRLDVVRVQVPPLRERLEDLPGLVERFLREALADAPRSPVRRVSPAALESMLSYRWPGNVRELQHQISRAVLLGRSEEIAPSDLTPEITAKASRVPSSALFETELIPVRELQKRYAAWATEKLGGHRSRAASALEVDGKTLSRWLSELPDPNPDATE